MNVDENPATAMEYNISGIPSVILFNNGKEEHRLIGVQPEEVYLNSVANLSAV